MRVIPAHWGDAARYAILPARIVEDDRATKIHWRLMGYLGRVNTNKGWLEFSQTELAVQWGYERRSLNNAVAQLVKWGYVEKRSQAETGTSRCHYRTLMDAPEVPGNAATSTVDTTDKIGESSAGSHAADGTDECHVADGTGAMQQMAGVPCRKAQSLDQGSIDLPPLPPEGEREGRGGLAKGWGKEALQAVDELRTSFTRSHIVPAFVEPVCSILNPPRQANGAAYLRQLTNRLGNYSEEALQRAGDALIEARKRDLPAVPDVVAVVKAAQKKLDLEGEQAAAASASPEAAVQSAAIRQSLARRVPAHVYRNWFAGLHVEELRDDGVLRLSQPVKFQASWVERNFLAELHAAAAEVFGVVKNIEVTHRRAAA